MIDLTESIAQPTVDQIRKEGGEAIAIGADITRTEDLKRIVPRTVDDFGLPNALFYTTFASTPSKHAPDLSREVHIAPVNRRHVLAAGFTRPSYRMGRGRHLETLGARRAGAESLLTGERREGLGASPMAGPVPLHGAWMSSGVGAT